MQQQMARTGKQQHCLLHQILWDQGWLKSLVCSIVLFTSSSAVVKSPRFLGLDWSRCQQRELSVFLICIPSAVGCCSPSSWDLLMMVLGPQMLLEQMPALLLGWEGGHTFLGVLCAAPTAPWSGMVSPTSCCPHGGDLLGRKLSRAVVSEGQRCPSVGM